MKNLKRTLLTAAQEGALGRRVQRGDQRAREELSEANLGLVRNQVARYIRPGLDPEDLFGEGCVGLMRAVDRFDPARGVRFSTFAVLWIRQAMGRAADQHAETGRHPVHWGQSLNRARKVRSQIETREGRDATPEEMAQGAGVGPGWAQVILQSLLPVASLDAPLMANVRLMDAIPGGESPERSVLSRIALEEMLACLTERERSVLSWRFGLGGGAGESLSEIGTRLRITRERVRQIERGALAKMRLRSLEAP